VSTDFFVDQTDSGQLPEGGWFPARQCDMVEIVNDKVALKEEKEQRHG
jgi:hypothetical protein